ncbi:Aste57867_22576 [Aphanomyces stellatus]|uniref:Aste57867_22576 protein n=1 Tax=Aphanomyces stellatus TaxID=120398 RepID=A0A485LKF3_9STRA|nr:hypothetical protein As57867_022506 [Aphanomyces stellatus]VFT99234.1 Aste57867_22576 [Aphanomyces stellatus]
MDKRKLESTSIKGKKKAKAPAGSIPITAFFSKVNPPPKDDVHIKQKPLLMEDQVDEIDDDDMSTTEAPLSSLATALPAVMVQSTFVVEKKSKEGPKVRRVPTALDRLLRREICGRTPNRDLHHTIRGILANYTTLPLTLLADIQPQQWISCMQFDSDGVLLVTGSSLGTIALYDFDEYFHRLIWFQNQNTNKPTPPSKLLVEPIHVIHTTREIKRIRWNPLNQVTLCMPLPSVNKKQFIECNCVLVYCAKRDIFVRFEEIPSGALSCVESPQSSVDGVLRLYFYQIESEINAPCIIAGDIDGAIRMWDVNVPAKPLWVISNTRDVGSINSICLCANDRYLICATDQSWILIYDTWNIVVPALGQRSSPKRLIMYSLLPLVQGATSSKLNISVGGVVSMQLAPDTTSTIVCQLLNDWVVVMDAMRPCIYKVHTVLRDPVLRNLPTDATTFARAELLPDWSSDVLFTRAESSFMKLHRCMGSFLFNGSIFATGFASDSNLYAIDMHAAPDGKNDFPLGASSSTVQSLRRLRIPMGQMVTAVTTHPVSNLVVCGMQSNALAVVGPGASNDFRE